MAGKKPLVGEKQPSEALFYGMIAGIGILVLLASFLIGIQTCIAKAKKTYGVTVGYLKSQCREYDNFLETDTAKSLFRITEQADNIGRTLEILPNDSQYEWIKEYTATQRLSTVILTDESLNTETVYTVSGVSEKELMANLPTDAIKQVAKYPVEIYSERFYINGGIYDVAAAARHDKKGAVLCFRLQNAVSMQNYYATVQRLLAGDATVLNGTVVITAGDRILSSNRDDISGEKSEFKTLGILDDKAKIGNVVRISDGEDNYYGGRAVYKEYGIYIYYRTADVFSDCFNVVVLALCFYFVAIIFIIAFHQRSKYLHMREIDDQYEIIRTVSRMFLFNVFVDIKKNRFKFLMRDADFAEVDESRPADDVLKTDFTNYAAEPYREEYLKFIDLLTVKQRLTGKDYIETEYQNIHGEWMNDIIIPKRNVKDGDFDSFLLVTKNITEQKKLEIEYKRRLEKAMQSEKRAGEIKTDLLRRMSHDLRTPINAILGMIEIADRNADNPEMLNYCRGQVKMAAEYLLELVNDILTLNRTEFDDKAEVSTAFDLREESEKVYTIVNMRAENAGIRLNTPEITGSGKRLFGNVLYFHQILINILINAVKYSNKGGEVKFSLSEEENGSGAIVRFVCSDNGIGISPEFQKKMFEPFAQENNEEISQYGGLGLGLAIVKTLTEKLGGTLSVSSSKGSGTRFEITLPFEYCSESEKSNDTENYSIAGLKILIAEDNLINMEIAEYLVRDAGAETVAAFDGREAVNIFASSAENEFDAILMDITMPITDGLKATEKIRALKRTDAKTVPIIAMTANLFIRDIEKCFAVGMNGYLPKPINEKQLIKTVAEKCAERYNNEN